MVNPEPEDVMKIKQNFAPVYNHSTTAYQKKTKSRKKNTHPNIITTNNKLLTLTSVRQYCTL